MYRVAILTSHRLFPERAGEDRVKVLLKEQMAKLEPAFAEIGVALESVDWRDAAKQAKRFDAMLPLLAWDYFDGNKSAFLSEMTDIASKTLLINDLETLIWNTDKSYLAELRKKGAPTIPTIEVDFVTSENVAGALDALNTDRVVIKPQVGGGAWRQVLYEKGAPLPDRDALPPDRAMIQAFLPSVQDEGEYSFLFFEGQFSHGVIKRPKRGDYRVQAVRGGWEEVYLPDESELAAAYSIMNTLDRVPVYARVDFLRHTDGALRLIELELIEPYLHLNGAKGEGVRNAGALRLANAVLSRLDSTKLAVPE